MNSSNISQNQFLGSGSFSNVYKVTLNNKVYALKKIHPYLLKDPSNRNAILKEIQIMKHLDHPSIIKFYDLVQTNDNEINLLLEYAQNGNLYTLLKMHQKLSEPQTICFIKDIVSAIKYLHSRPYPILHRDIKPQNILLTNQNKCKLADFGSSNVLDQQRYTFAGTKEYMAPQILKNQSYGKQVDLWCLGVLIYEMLTGTLPKHENGNVALPPSVSRPAEDVVKRLLHPDPSMRMTLEELEQHIWFVDIEERISVNEGKINLGTDRKSSAMERLNKIKQLKQVSIGSYKRVSEKHKQLKAQNSKQKQKKNQQIVSLQSSQNLQLVQYLSQLKITLLQQKKLILSSIGDFQTTKLTKLTQLYRLSQKLNEYTNNIQTLTKKYPLKFNQQLEETIKGFMKKVDNLQQYVEYFPTKLEEEAVEMPDISSVGEGKKPVVSIEMLKMRTYMLNCQKDVLAEIIKAKRNYQLIVQARQQQD